MHLNGCFLNMITCRKYKEDICGLIQSSGKGSKLDFENNLFLPLLLFQNLSPLFLFQILSLLSFCFRFSLSTLSVSDFLSLSPIFLFQILSPLFSQITFHGFTFTENVIIKILLIYSQLLFQTDSSSASGELWKVKWTREGEKERRTEEMKRGMKRWIGQKKKRKGMKIMIPFIK